MYRIIIVYNFILFCKINKGIKIFSKCLVSFNDICTQYYCNCRSTTQVPGIQISSSLFILKGQGLEVDIRERLGFITTPLMVVETPTMAALQPPPLELCLHE